MFSLILTLALCAQFQEEAYTIEQAERDLILAQELFEREERNALSKIFNHHGANAEEILVRVFEKFPGSATAEKALRTLIDHLGQTKEWGRQETYLQLFVENFPDSSEMGTIQKLRMVAAIQQYRGPQYDMSPIERILRYREELMELDPEAWPKLIEEYPLLDRLDEERAQHLLTQADFYRKRGDVVSQKFVLHRLLKRFPETSTAQKARQQIDRLTAR